MQEILLNNKIVNKWTKNCLISIYPNPAGDIEKIVISSQCQFNKTKIIDIYGNEVYTLSTNDNTSLTNMSVLSLSNLTSGTYFIKLTLSNGQSVQKKIFIK